MIETRKIKPEDGLALLNELNASAPGDNLRTVYYRTKLEADGELVKSPGTDLTGNIIIFDIDDVFYSSFKCIEWVGEKTVLVKPGKVFAQTDDRVYEINPDETDDYRMLFKALKKVGITPEKIIHMWSKEAFGYESGTIGSQLNMGVYSLFHISKSIMEQKHNGNVNLLYIYFMEKGQYQPVYAAASGVAKTVHRENPKFTYKTVGVELWPSLDSSNITDIISKELGTSSQDSEIYYKTGTRFVKRLEEFTTENTTGSLPIRQNGVYLITGGMGGLGFIFAEYLAKKYKASLILTGRSGIDDVKALKIKELEAFGAQVMYAEGDISNSKDIENIITGAKNRFKEINGVIHSAGVVRDSFILKKSKADIDAVLEPKVYGTVLLHKAFENISLDFFVMFSSTSSVKGNVGQCDYAAANSFMDNFSVMRAATYPTSKTLAINWPLWKYGGMKVDEETVLQMKKNTGIVPLSTESGIKAFEEGLKAGVSELLVAEGDVKGIRKTFNLKEQATGEVKTENLELGEKDLELLTQEAEQYLKEVFSKEIKLPPNKIKSKEPLEQYGIDSVVIMEVNRELEAHFGELSKTLLFEYQSISELTQYFIKNHKQQLVEKIKGFNKPQPVKHAKMVTEALQKPDESIINGQSRFIKTRENSTFEEIAIIGLSGRYPLSKNSDEFWQNLKEGRDCITEIPADRWDYRKDFHPDKNKKGKTYSKWGGFIDDVDKFDPLFFNISPNEARTMDPQERIFLETVWQTIEDAGYSRSRLSKTEVGVFVGVMYGQYQLYGAEESLKGNVMALESSFASIANRVSYFFNFSGPSISMDTMCSSSLTAIHMACQSIRRGESSMAIAGGVNITIHPNKYILLSQGKFASSEGKCRAFGAGGDGYVPGEGVGAVLLKPLSKAVEDSDRIYAVIKGSSINHGGKTNGYTVPNPNAQGNVILDALKKSNIDPRTISYIEAHGTGTSLGDPIEITGLIKAFGEYTKDKQFCAIGSVKANIGHLESAAGMASLTKVLLQMKYKQLVPSILSETLNPNINFTESPFFVQRELAEWKQPVINQNGSEERYPRRAGISSFGAGGANAHIIFEEYENSTNQYIDNNESKIVVLSAKKKDRLNEYAANLLEMFKKAKEQKEALELCDVVFTLQIGREAMEERLALVVSDMDELIENLSLYCHGVQETGKLYTGNIKNQTDPLLEGKEGDELIINALKNKETDRIAQLWVAGADIDWMLLYPIAVPRRISLPLYPFAKESYWIPKGEKNIGLGAGQSLVPSLHPLIDRNESTLDEQCFKKILTGSEFYMRDHVIGGENMLPGSVYIEMARAAGDLANKAGKVIAIKDIVWARPVTVSEEPKEITVSLFPEGNDVEFEISGVTQSGNNIIHSQGKLIYGTLEDEPGHINIEEIKSRCTTDKDIDTFYDEFAKKGFNYGDGMRAVKTLVCNTGEALSLLELPSEYEAAVDGFILHPVLVDGAFQTAAGITGIAKDGVMYLPYAIGHIDIKGIPGKKCYAYVKFNESEVDLIKNNIWLLDEDGRIIAVIKDFVVRAATPNGEKAGVSMIYFKNSWESLAVEKVKELPVEGPVMLFDIDDLLFKSFVKRFGKERAILVTPGQAFADRGDNVYEIDPADGEDYVRLTKQLKNRGIIPAAIVHMWSKVEEESYKNKLKYMQKMGVYSLLNLTKALMQFKGKTGVKILYIYKQGNAIEPLHAAIGGFAKTLSMENPAFNLRAVGIKGSMDKNNLVQTICDEFGSDIFEAEVLYDCGERFVKHIKEFKEDGKDVTLPIKEKGVYLITGGMGGLGVIFAQYLAKNFKAKVVLTGRSPLNPEKQKRLDEIKKFTQGSTYIPADISCKESVFELVSKIEASIGRIDGIIHAAGVIRDSFIFKKTVDEMEDVLAPKVYGTVWLDEAVRDHNPGFFVMFSSTAGVTGNIGQCDYAYANSFMDNYAQARTDENPSSKTLSINWPYWQDGGMQLDAQTISSIKADIGMVSLSTDSGIKAFEDGLKSSCPQLMVIEGNREKIIKSFTTSSRETGEATKTIELDEKERAELKQKAQEFLKALLAAEIGLPQSRIDEKEALEEYGIDSVMVMNLSRELGEHFGQIPKTLFYEYKTIAELSEYFTENYTEKLIEKLGGTKKPQSVKVSPKTVGNELKTLRRNRFMNAENGESTNEIAIIGLSGQYPMAKTPEEFWENLKSGKDCITEIPDNRWDHSLFFNPDKNIKGKAYSKWGGFIDNIYKFDPLLFNISPREAKIMDPQERLFLKCVWNAMEDAGYTKTYLEKNNNVGVFVGIMWGQYQMYGTDQSLWEIGMIPGSSYASVANRVSYFFNLNGPSMAVDTMCSSSLTAIHLACDSIRKGESEMAVAGGVNLAVHPCKYLMLSQGKFMSTDGRCRAFGEGGDGYVPGEGVGAVILKSLSKAVRDGDYIYGVIKATALNHGGKTNGYTVPNPNAQGNLIAKALKKAKIDPSTISYIEAHGTGTSLGDPIEIAGLMKAFCEYTKDTQFCSIGSVKTNIGHLESAAGIAGITKVLLQMKHKQLVPSIHTDILNQNIDFESSPFYVQRELSAWEQPVRKENGVERKYPRRCGVSAFGAGGSNAHVIIEEYEDNNEEITNEDSEPQVIVLSAKTEEQLKIYAREINDFLLKALGPIQQDNRECILTGIREDLIKQVASLLNVDEINIDINEKISEYGFDAIGFAELADGINRILGIEITPALFTECATVKAISEHLYKVCGEKAEALYSVPEIKNESTRSNASQLSLVNIAYTLQTGREMMEERLAMVVSSIVEMQEVLSNYHNGKEDGRLYIGNKKAYKLSSGLLAEGEEAEEFIKKTLTARKLDKLSQLWICGVDIDWKLLYNDIKPKKMSLPKYPFVEEECKLPIDQFKPSPFEFRDEAVPIMESLTHLKAYILEKSWKKASGDIIPVDIKGTVVVLANDETAAMADKILENANIVIIKKGLSFETTSKTITFDYSDSNQGEKAAAGIINTVAGITGIIDLSDLYANSVDKTTGGLGRIKLLQTLIKNIKSDRLCILHITKGLHKFAGVPMSLAGADIAGLYKMLGAEYRRVISKTIDTDNLDRNHIRQIVLNEWSMSDSYSEVCYRSGQRHVSVMSEIFRKELGELKAGIKPMSPDPSKVVVITGGTRGIGAEVARHLVNNGARKLVLMGKQQFPKRETWNEIVNGSRADSSEAFKIKMVLELENKGAAVEICSGSLTEKTELQAYFEGIRKKLGKIEGVIHCAGLAIADNPAFINKNVSDIEKVLEPKVAGLQTLHEIFAGDELSYFVLFSSVSSTVPILGAGMSDYACANAFMDYFAAFRSSKGTVSYKSINWCNWKEIGIGEVASTSYKNFGLFAYSTQDGLTLFDKMAENTENCCLMPCIADSDIFMPEGLLKAKQQSVNMVKGNPAKENSVIIPGNAITESKGIMQKLVELFSAELAIDAEKLEGDVPFGDYGVDSVMLAELVKKIEGFVGGKLDPSVLLEYPTLKQLNNYLSTNFSIEAVSNGEEEVTGSEDDIFTGNAMSSSANTVSQVYSSTVKVPKLVDEDRAASRNKVAVIGMACNFPRASDKDKYWENLRNGKNCITEIPKTRWDIDEYYTTLYQKGKSISKWGGFIEGIEYFDPKYFNLNEEDAPNIDPLMRQLMEVSVQAVRDAGYEADELYGKKVGVYVGSRIGEYSSRAGEPTKNAIIGAGQNFIGAHISHFLNLKGPNMVLDTACSSSLVSIHLACQGLLLNETEMAIAGGVDILLDEKSYIMLSESRALSPDGKCHTFDEKANGFVPGEGCGVVILKSLEKAIQDGDRIYAVIDVSAVNNDGHTMGITTPNPEAQSEVIMEALKKGNINPNSVSYIETHGTGTMIGDPIELRALTKVFSQFTDEKQFCGVGSVKTNMGHLLSAAGIASFMKVVLSIQNKLLPPTLNCETPNPRFEFKNSPLYPNTSLTEWKPREGTRRAGISAFGFGGTNAHMIVSECDTGLLKNYSMKRKPLSPIEFNKKRYWREKIRFNTIGPEANIREKASPTHRVGSSMLKLEKKRI